MKRPGLSGFTSRGLEKIIEHQGGKQKVKDDRLCRAYARNDSSTL